MIILGASVAVKWFRAEADSDLADHLYQKHTGTLAAPDLFAIEVAAALVREANTVKALQPAMEQALAMFFERMGDGTIKLFSSSPSELEHAARLALDLRHPLKDCIYLSSAISRDCLLVTADARFVAKAQQTGAKLRLLSDFK